MFNSRILFGEVVVHGIKTFRLGKKRGKMSFRPMSLHVGGWWAADWTFLEESRLPHSWTNFVYIHVPQLRFSKRSPFHHPISSEKLEAGGQIGGRQLIPEEVGPDSGSSESATSDEFSSQRSLVAHLIRSFGWKMRQVFTSWKIKWEFARRMHHTATVPNSWLNTLSKNEM